MKPPSSARLMLLDSASLEEVVRLVLGRGGRMPLVVGGDSMEPALRDGQTVVVRSFRRGEVMPGDVVLCRRAARLQMHRVALVGRGGVVTWGDALSEPDGLAGWDEVLGIVEGTRGQVRPLPRKSLGERLLGAFSRRLLLSAALQGGRP